MVNIDRISDELLAAFLEGRTDPVDTVRILNAIASDSDLAKLVNDAYVLDEIDKISRQVGDETLIPFGIEPVASSDDVSETKAVTFNPEGSFGKDILPVAALKTSDTFPSGRK